MSPIAWVLLGVVIAAIGVVLFRVRKPPELLITVAVAVGGALFGGAAARSIMVSTNPQRGTVVFAALLGAILLLAMYRLVLTRPRDSL